MSASCHNKHYSRHIFRSTVCQSTQQRKGQNIFRSIPFGGSFPKAQVLVARHCLPSVHSKESICRSGDCLRFNLHNGGENDSSVAIILEWETRAFLRSMQMTEDIGQVLTCGAPANRQHHHANIQLR